MESVLGQPHNSPMAEALIHKDYFDIPSLIGMSTSDIDGLTTLQTQAIGGDAYTARVQMSSGLRGLLKAFKGYARWLQRNGEGLDFEAFLFPLLPSCFPLFS